MIGQTNNKEIIDNWRFNRSIPRCILIKGQPGSGRYTLGKYIASILGIDTVDVECGKNDVKDVIATAYSCQTAQCYIFRNIDVDMSESAKNALLKIVEEPPNKSYFIMTTQLDVLETIESRCTIMYMEPYSRQELCNFCDNDKLLNYYCTPGKLLYWQENDFDSFYSFCEESVNTLFNGTGVQSLQFTNRLALKADSEGYDCVEFIDIISSMISNRLLDIMNVHCFMLFISRTAECRRALNNKSIKKDSCIDTYILWVRDFIQYLKEESTS